VTVSAADRSRLGIESDGPAIGVVLVRRQFDPLAGEWSLPGGAVELGETLAAAIAREVLEETGLTVDVGPVVDVFDPIVLDQSQGVKHHYVLIDFICRASGGRLMQGSDASEAIVADPSDLERYRLTEKAHSVIARALRMIAALPR
jgi:8-oxo-dGTP diphosphatase